MNLVEFRDTLQAPNPPQDISIALQAMWYEAKGDWEKSHTLSQSLPDSEGAWVHAYLHRREGDIGNAGYWYRRAGKPAASGSLDDEWSSIVEELLAE